jgi:copper(I)-binding protein
MAVEGGVMKMRQLDRIELPAGRPVKLGPGGLHVMLMDLRQALKPGDRVPLALTVQRPDSSRVVFTVEAEVRATAPATGHHH